MKTDDIVYINKENFKCNGRILEINGEEASVYVTSKEMVFNIQISDIVSTSKKSQFSPKSRKDIYIFIHKKSTKSKDIIDLFQSLEKGNKLTYSKKFSKSAFKTLITTKSKMEIVEKIRELRDQGFIKFELPNNSHNPRSKEVDEQIQEGKKYNY